MSHLTTRDRTVWPDGYAAALRILRRLLAGIERPPALRLGDMLLHELESHPEYTLIIRDPGLLRRLVLRRIRCCWRKPISAAPSTLRETCTPRSGSRRISRGFRSLGATNWPCCATHCCCACPTRTG